MKKFIFWFPRGLAICFILFLGLFALDVFSISDSWYRLLVAFLIHLIPDFILLAITILAWKKPFWGGWLFIFAAVALAFWVNFNLISWPVVLPPAVIGVLFLIQYYYFKKYEKNQLPS
ncbi:MAG: hypothetical protein WC508_01035 [Patescibacteria group bacterium]